VDVWVGVGDDEKDALTLLIGMKKKKDPARTYTYTLC
jgi:hypothetical protein